MTETQNSRQRRGSPKAAKVKKFFNIFNFLLAILTFAFLLLPSSIFAAAATLSLSPSGGTYNPGCAFSVDINLDTGGAQTDGTDTILFYDTSRLTASSIRSGTIYADYPGNNIDSQNGRITVSGLASISSAFSGSGTLATIDFKVNDSAPAGVTQVTFDFDPNNKGKTTDSNVVERGTVVDILNQVGNGSYTIGSGTSCTGGGSGGSGKTPVGGPEPTKVPVELPQGGSFETTLMVGLAGGILIIFGLIGLALL